MNGMKSIKLRKDGKKQNGETLYITTGLLRNDSYSTRIDVNEIGLKISTYRNTNGAMIDEYLLTK